MDMRQFSGGHFIKCDDVRNGPLQMQIAVVREGKFGKPDLVFETGDVFSVNATNNNVLIRAYGVNSVDWGAKIIELFLGEIKYQGKMQEAVLVKPISPSLKAAEQTKLKTTERTTKRKPKGGGGEGGGVGGMDDPIPI
jgi:hypothetical protein